MKPPTTTSDYLSDLFVRFWAYRRRTFGDSDYFDRPVSDTQKRPPVFKSLHVDKNVLVRPGSSPLEQAAVVRTLTRQKRHTLFASMRSSQALTQSVFGNLKVGKQLDCLIDLQDETGLNLFPIAAPEACLLEHEVDYLGEAKRAQTSVDVMFIKGYRIALECKLAEDQFGACSRPDLKDDDPQYLTDFCNGSHTLQMNRKERCALTGKGIRYWEFVPQLTSWSADVDHVPCPLRSTYQILRTLLAACVSPMPHPALDPTNGHVVVVFDDRNPAFRPGGQAHSALLATKTCLKDPTRLRKCSWQQIATAMRRNSQLAWLTDALSLKYGF